MTGPRQAYCPSVLTPSDPLQMLALPSPAPQDLWGTWDQLVHPRAPSAPGNRSPGINRSRERLQAAQHRRLVT